MEQSNKTKGKFVKRLYELCKMSKTTIFIFHLLESFASQLQKFRPGYHEKEAMKWTAKGRQMLREGKYLEAVDAFNKSIELNPRSAFTFYSRGNGFTCLHIYRRAIMDFDTAIRLDPEHVDAYYHRARMYVRLDNREQAIKDYDKVIELKPGHVRAYEERGSAGQAYEKLGNNQQSVEDCIVAAKSGLSEAQQFLMEKGIRWQEEADVNVRKYSEEITKSGVLFGTEEERERVYELAENAKKIVQ